MCDQSFPIRPGDDSRCSLRFCLPGERRLDVWLHGFGQKLHYRHDNCIAELTVCLGVRHWNLPATVAPVETHQARAFKRGEATGALAGLVNEHFRAVLVVTGGEGAGDIVRAEQAVAEAIALGGMLGLVCLEVFPQPLGQRVLGVNLVVGLENAAELWPTSRQFQVTEVKIGRLPETDNKDALTALSHPMFRADDARLDMIAQLVPQHIHDRGEGVALVVTLKVLDVFEYKRRRTMVGNDLGGVEEQGALRVTEKTMRTAERILF